MRTDFETYGFRQGPSHVPERRWWLTIDFEAFTPSATPLWCRAMQHWADRTRQHALRFALFVSVEQVVALRAADRATYQHFLDSIRSLHQAGCDFYPHNHFVFETDTGRRPSEALASSQTPREYSKRMSMFYDAVYRCGVRFETWMGRVSDAYQSFLVDAGIARPRVLAFRAGGWDYGSSRNDLRQYIDGLIAAGFGVDSSACRGSYGTRSWQVGLPFGSNVFRIHPALLEVAPCWQLNCGADGPLGVVATQLRDLLKSGVCSPLRRSGVFVVVIHFDHLFHETLNGSLRYFHVTDFARIAKRIDRLFVQLSFWRFVLRLNGAGIDHLAPTPL